VKPRIELVRAGKYQRIHAQNMAVAARLTMWAIVAGLVIFVAAYAVTGR
jgi:hypothetical protein